MALHTRWYSCKNVPSFCWEDVDPAHTLLMFTSVYRTSHGTHSPYNLSTACVILSTQSILSASVSPGSSCSPLHRAVDKLSDSRPLASHSLHTATGLPHSLYCTLSIPYAIQILCQVFRIHPTHYCTPLSPFLLFCSFDTLLHLFPFSFNLPVNFARSFAFTLHITNVSSYKFCHLTQIIIASYQTATIAFQREQLCDTYQLQLKMARFQ